MEIGKRAQRLVIGLLAGLVCSIGAVQAQGACQAGRLYLTLDTGNMRHAEYIAGVLRKHQVRATFFLAQELTTRGDSALDPPWDSFWRGLAGEGHQFGSHAWRHGKFLKDQDGGVQYRPQFGDGAGKVQTLDQAGVCRELNLVQQAFERATGRKLDPFWRAPGGRTTPFALKAARQCGYAHVHWAPAGFLGDELPSESWPNERLVAQTLQRVRDGDILMAHLGIWSRKDPYAPMLDGLIATLKQRGFCFATLRDHPAAQAAQLP